MFYTTRGSFRGDEPRASGDVNAVVVFAYHPYKSVDFGTIYSSLGRGRTQDTRHIERWTRAIDRGKVGGARGVKRTRRDAPGCVN